VNMNKLIENLEKLLRRTIPEDVAIEVLPDPYIDMVMADSGQIEQVIMNLASNAADAMPEGGRLIIETAQMDLDEAYADAHPDVEPGRYLMLSVADSGSGMDEETQERIFEPFFSTKGEGGTGLGLATVYGIVKQHGGSIWVYSELGTGSTFRVLLPVAEPNRIEKKAGGEPPAARTGHETILLVEDNEQVRSLVFTMLKRMGYTVLAASNGRPALSVAGSHEGPLHLLLTDVVMPEMNGKELFAKTARKHPDLKVLYTSGYTDQVIAHRGVLNRGVAFIQKPFTVDALAAKVREVLDRR
jgi:two-component system cell cycle sensor histidine kinase/response regulator CckA